MAPTFKPTTLAPTPTAALTTAVPTRRPSKMPTIAPTLAPAITPYPTVAPTQGVALYFYVSQTLSGINSATFYANQAVNEKALKKTIAACMSGITEDEITSLFISDVDRRRRLSMRGDGAFDAEVNMLSTSSVSATYFVSSPSSAYSYSDLVSELNTKITSGDFAAILSDTSADLGGSLSGVSAEPATAVDFNTDYSAAVKKLLTTVLIIVIAVIASVVGLCLIAVIVFFFVLGRDTKAAVAPQTMPISPVPQSPNKVHPNDQQHYQIVATGNHQATF
jgi:hypothetical protein